MAFARVLEFDRLDGSHSLLELDRSHVPFRLQKSSDASWVWPDRFAPFSRLTLLSLYMVMWCNLKSLNFNFHSRLTFTTSSRMQWWTNELSSKKERKKEKEKKRKKKQQLSMIQSLQMLHNEIKIPNPSSKRIERSNCVIKEQSAQIIMNRFTMCVTSRKARHYFFS